MGDFKLLQIGVKENKPSLILDYEVVATGKRRRRVMPVDPTLAGNEYVCRTSLLSCLLNRPLLATSPSAAPARCQYT